MESKPLPSIGVTLDSKYDWYQNMTHTFVSYKVKGGEANETTIKTNLFADQFNIENINTGEQLASV